MQVKKAPCFTQGAWFHTTCYQKVHEMRSYGLFPCGTNEKSTRSLGNYAVVKFTYERIEKLEGKYFCRTNYFELLLLGRLLDQLIPDHFVVDLTWFGWCIVAIGFAKVRPMSEPWFHLHGRMSHLGETTLS